MVEDFMLDPMSDLELEIIVPGWIRPYLQNYFIDKKEDGESVNNFLVRIMGKNSLDHRLEKLSIDIQTEYHDPVITDYYTEIEKL